MQREPLLAVGSSNTTRVGKAKKFWGTGFCSKQKTSVDVHKRQSPHTRVWPRIRDQATMFILCYRFGCQCPANRPAKTVSIKHIAGQRGTVAGHSVPRPSRRRLFRKKHKFDENKKHEKMLTPILARIAACAQETSKNANPYLSERFSCARHADM